MAVTIIDDTNLKIGIEPDPVVIAKIEPAPSVSVRVFDGGVIRDEFNSLPPEYDLNVGVLRDYPNSYKELHYSNGDLSRIDIWKTTDKDLKLITKIFSYRNGLLTSIIAINNLLKVAITKTLIYSENGTDLIAINTVNTVPALVLGSTEIRRVSGLGIPRTELRKVESLGLPNARLRPTPTLSIKSATTRSVSALSIKKAIIRRVLA
ncbi:MAG: hypothetical protein AAGF93_00540 [Cyanobacteria bacterium P01_H01_bin.105]